MTITLPDAPLDGISKIRFGREQCSTHLLVSSWDSQVRLYDAGSAKLLNSRTHSSAVLDCMFLESDSRVLCGGLDRRVVMHDFQSSEESELGRHDEAVRCVEFDVATRQVYTGSWDRSVRLWDPRQAGTPTSTLLLGSKVFALDVSNNNIVVGGSDRCVHIYDRRMVSAGSTQPMERRESILHHQIRALKIGNDPRFYVSGSAEGRVGVEYFDAEDNAKSQYAFKCHRVKTEAGEDIHPVNCIDFHPVHGTCATGGSDGGVCVWDAYAKKRLWRMSPQSTSISSLSFSPDGSMLAVAVSYTFDQGAKTPMQPSELIIHRIHGEEVLPKSRQR